MIILATWSSSPCPQDTGQPFIDYCSEQKDPVVATHPSLSEAFEAICVMDAPLNTRLAAYANKLRELNFPFAEAYDELVGRLIVGEIGTAAPKVGDAMPPFVLPARGGQLVGLEDLLQTGPVVISFNRRHWCPFCKIELRTIARYHGEIAAIGGQVVSIIPDASSLQISSIETRTASWSS